MSLTRDIDTIPLPDRDVCPNCKTINDRRKDTECVFCDWVLVAWACPYCKQPNDADDYPTCRGCKKDARLYGQRSLLEMTIDAWWETTCDEDTDLVAISLDTAGCQSTHQYRLTISEATELHNLVGAALRDAEAFRAEETDIDPILVALHSVAPALYPLATHFQAPLYISQDPDGNGVVFTPYPPPIDIYLCVAPDGTKTLTDERGDR